MEGASLKPYMLEMAGRALFGAQWRRPLAAALDVDARLIQRWAAGEREIPWTETPKVLALLEREATSSEWRARDLRGAAAAIEGFK